jgi:hypothetical protein
VRAVEAKRLALDVALLMAAVACGAVLALLVQQYVELLRPPPPVESRAEVVRMLDVTIRDSNTTNRRQRFECRPVETRKGRK